MDSDHLFANQIGCCFILLSKTIQILHNLNDQCCHWLLWFKLCIVAIWGKFRLGPVWDHWLRTISPQSEKDKGLSRQDLLLMHWAQGLQKEHWLCTLKNHGNSKGLVKAAANSPRCHWPWLHFRGQAFPARFSAGRLFWGVRNKWDLSSR